MLSVITISKQHSVFFWGDYFQQWIISTNIYCPSLTFHVNTFVLQTKQKYRICKHFNSQMTPVFAGLNNEIVLWKASLDKCHLFKAHNSCNKILHAYFYISPYCKCYLFLIYTKLSFFLFYYCFVLVRL